MKQPIILSLFDHSGNWSKPYRDAGYEVRQYDLKNGDDVRFLTVPWEETVHGILGAPPCTVFANSGARWPRTNEEMAAGLALVDATLRFVAMCKPQWWAMENPVGKLGRWIGPPQLRFHPCEFGGWVEGGDAYTKRTCLWGDFAAPEKRPVEPTEGSKMHTQYGGKSERTKQARSITPLGFARAFFEANP